MDSEMKAFFGALQSVRQEELLRAFSKTKDVKELYTALIGLRENLKNLCKDAEHVLPAYIIRGCLAEIYQLYEQKTIEEASGEIISVPEEIYKVFYSDHDLFLNAEGEKGFRNDDGTFIRIK